jgi:Flp pilus assembly secretin CpaC
MIEVEPELQELADELREILADVEGLDVNVIGDKVILSGKLLSNTDLETVKETASAFKARVVAMVELDMNVNELIKKALEKEIGIDTVELILEGDKLTAMGSVPNQAELERVKAILKRRHDNVVLLLMVAQ